jgi:hypothetical protein
MSLYRKNLDRHIDGLRIADLELRNVVFAHKRGLIDAREFAEAVDRLEATIKNTLQAHDLLLEVEAKYDALADEEAKTKLEAEALQERANNAHSEWAASEDSNEVAQ